MLATTISCTSGASSSAYRLRHYAGILSTPVAFFGFKCFRTVLTWPIDGRGGGESLSKCSTASSLGESG